MSGLFILLAAANADSRAEEERSAQKKQDQEFTDLCSHPDAEKLKTFLRAANENWLLENSSRLKKIVATGSAPMVTAALAHVQSSPDYKTYPSLTQATLENASENAPAGIKLLFNGILQDIERLWNDKVFVAAAEDNKVTTAFQRLKQGADLHAENDAALVAASKIGGGLINGLKSIFAAGSGKKENPLLDMLLKKLHHQYDDAKDCTRAVSALKKAFAAASRMNKPAIRTALDYFETKAKDKKWKFD